MRVVVLALGVGLIVGLLSGPAPAAQRPDALRLLARHAPVLVLHPDDPFGPVPVDGFLADSDVTAQAPDGTWVPQPGPPPAGGAELRLDQRSCRAADGPASRSCYAASQSAHPSPPTTYGAAFRGRTGIALQYWLFYPYDVWAQTGAKGEVWRAHEGDWEMVTVLLDTRERPVLLGLSRHCGGVRRPWARVARSGTHPVVFVALGSHANELRAGTTRQALVCWPEAAQAVLTAFGVVPRDVAAAGRRVRPAIVTVTSTRPPWMQFAGRWGEAQYAGFPGVDPLAFGAGPEGPAFHTIWRRPFAEPLTWPSG